MFLYEFKCIYSLNKFDLKTKQKNKDSPKTAFIYLSVPLRWSFLFDLVLLSVLKSFICPNMDFLSLS